MTGPIDAAARVGSRAWKGVKRPFRTARAVRDASKFPVGPTPREEVWSLNKTTLYHYKPTRPPEERHPVPLLLVFAAINRPFLLDMRKGYSFIEFMVDEGYDVYLLDWGQPGAEDGDAVLDDYGSDYVPRAVRRVLEHSGASEVSMLGYCLGALIVLVYAALFPDGPTRNVILLTPPVDMSEDGDSKFHAWLNQRWFDVDKFADDLGGLLPSFAIENGGKMLKAVANYVGAYVSLWDRIEDPEAVANWQAMHRWIHDGVPLPANVFRQWVRDYLWGNALVSGKHVVGGEYVDLRNVTAALLMVVARYDHIVPNPQSMPVLELVGSDDKAVEMINAGHIGIMAGSRARNVLWPRLAAWLALRSALERYDPSEEE